MAEPVNTPCSQSRHSNTSGTTVERRPPNRKASMGTPAGSCHSVAIEGRCAAGVVKRAFGCAAVGGPGIPLPVHGGIRRLPGHALPPDVAVGADGEDRVALDRGHRGVGLVARVRGHPEETGLGVDRVEATIVAEPHPGDVVADGLDLPIGQRRDQHRQVRLATGGGEGAGDVLDGALGRGQLQDQHVLGQPALVVGHRRGDPQREALLAEQSVAAIARSNDQISRLSG